MKFPFRDIIFPECDDISIVTLPIAEIDIKQSLIEIPHDLQSAMESRKREYIAGRLCAQKAIERITGEQIAVGRDERGLPVWPPSIIGSISHSSKLACAAVADRALYSRLGIDVEEVVTNEHVEGLLSVCASPKEQVLFMTPTKATLLFAAKEAFYKAFYTDLGGIIEFSDIDGEFLRTDANVRITTTKKLGSVPLGFCVKVQVQIEAGLIVALCACLNNQTKALS